jgi:hypothetical protein
MSWSFLCLLALPLVSASSHIMEGIHLPSFRLVEDKTLTLNGAGVRSVSFFGLHVKVYVAGLYTERPMLEASDNVDQMMQLDFTFLRDVNQYRVTSAWESQLEDSVSHRHYDGYPKDRDRFISMFGPIKQGGTETVLLMGDDTVIIDQGVQKGRIAGRDFQKAFLSMWFGERAVAADLKSGLLGGHSHQHAVKVTTTA